MSLNIKPIGIVLFLTFGHFAVAAPATTRDCRGLLSSSHLDSNQPTPWFSKISFTQTEKTLLTGKIVKMQDLKQSLSESGKTPSGTTTEMLLLTFEDGTVGVWKPGQWTPLGEVGAYRASRVVGSRLVPPTVLRTLDRQSFDTAKIPSEVADKVIGQTGSIQYFVESPVDLLKLNRTQRQEILLRVPEKQKSDRDIFNFVFGQWDRHWGNIIIDESNSIASIDNSDMRSRQMVRYGELPFVKKLTFSPEAREKLKWKLPKLFPFDQAILLVKPTKEVFANIVGMFVAPARIEAYWKWRENTADTTMKIAFWDNSVWVQSIGFANYGPSAPSVFSEKTLSAYRRLTFQILREALPAEGFSDQVIHEILERRDQLLKAAQTAPKIP